MFWPIVFILSFLAIGLSLEAIYKKIYNKGVKSVYTPNASELLQDAKCFILYQLQEIYMIQKGIIHTNRPRQFHEDRRVAFTKELDLINKGEVSLDFSTNPNKIHFDNLLRTAKCWHGLSKAVKEDTAKLVLFEKMLAEIEKKQS